MHIHVHWHSLWKQHIVDLNRIVINHCVHERYCIGTFTSVTSQHLPKHLQNISLYNFPSLRMEIIAHGNHIGSYYFLSRKAVIRLPCTANTWVVMIWRRKSRCINSISSDIVFPRYPGLIWQHYPLLHHHSVIWNPIIAFFQKPQKYDISDVIGNQLVHAPWINM